jgi:hypothetical protein
MKSYVTYAVDGSLTGGFLQEIPQGLSSFIEVDREVRVNWPMYKANDARDGVELLPPPTPVVTVPFEVTMRQARLALFGAGILSGVQPAIDALSEPTKTAAQIEWEYSNTLQRTNPFVATLGAALGLTGAQIDALFIAAEKL